MDNNLKLSQLNKDKSLLNQGLGMLNLTTVLLNNPNIDYNTKLIINTIADIEVTKLTTMMEDK